MEIPVRMVDTVVAATAPAGTKKQSSAGRRNTFIQFLSLSFVGEELSFLHPEAVLLVHELDDLRDGITFSQFCPDEAFFLHGSLGHVALALSQRQLSTALTGAFEIHGHLPDLVLYRVCCCGRYHLDSR